MNEIRFISGTAALASFGNDLVADINERIDGGKFSASGALKASNTATTTEIGAGGAVMELSALSHWRYLGNGRGPGRMPPVSPLARWTLAKGLATTPDAANAIAWGIARAIARDGSLDHQLGGKNQYDQAITKAQPKIPKIIEAFFRDIDAPVSATFQGLLKRA